MKKKKDITLDDLVKEEEEVKQPQMTKIEDTAVINLKEVIKHGKKEKRK